MVFMVGSVWVFAVASALVEQVAAVQTPVAEPASVVFWPRTIDTETAAPGFSIFCQPSAQTRCLT